MSIRLGEIEVDHDLIGIVSDVHSAHKALREDVIPKLASSGARTILQLGDYCLPHPRTAISEREAAATSRVAARHSIQLLALNGNHAHLDLVGKMPADPVTGIRWFRTGVHGLLPRIGRIRTSSGAVIAIADGAGSVDRDVRHYYGGKWFQREVLSGLEMWTLADRIAEDPERPSLLIAHDAPRTPEVIRRLHGNSGQWTPSSLAYANACAQAFTEWVVHSIRPRLVTSGHLHLPITSTGHVTDATGDWQYTSVVFPQVGDELRRWRSHALVDLSAPTAPRYGFWDDEIDGYGMVHTA